MKKKMPPKGYKTVTVKNRIYRALVRLQLEKGYKSPAEAVERLLKVIGYL